MCHQNNDHIYLTYYTLLLLEGYNFTFVRLYKFNNFRHRERLIFNHFNRHVKFAVGRIEKREVVRVIVVVVSVDRPPIEFSLQRIGVVDELELNAFIV